MDDKAAYLRDLLQPKLFFLHPQWLNFTCSRSDKHILRFCFLIKSSTIVKIGQFPSSADLLTAEIKKYQKFLGQSDASEFHKAIGLNAHGVGIGAFVYLRRIFERLVFRAKNEAVENGDNSVGEGFRQLPMDEKIDRLKNYLPTFLYRNKKIYGILSKGIHELSEETCLKIFPVIKDGIELILDEQIKRVEQDKKEKNAERSIAEIGGNL